MNIRNRIHKLEEKSGNAFKVAIAKGEFIDGKGNPISTEEGYPRNLEEDVHFAVVSVSDCDETVTLHREHEEPGADFMLRFDETANLIGKRAGATVTLRWDVKWI